MLLYNKQIYYESFLIDKEFVSTEDRDLFENLTKQKDELSIIFKDFFGDSYPSFSDLIKLYIFVLGIATQEQKKNIINSMKKSSNYSKRTINLFIFPIKFLEYYQPLIEENIFPFIPSENNREKISRKREKSKHQFYIVKRENKIQHVYECDPSDIILESYRDASQHLTYHITQFELNNITDYYNMSQSIHNCQDSISLKKVLKDKYGVDANFFDIEFSTYSMDTNQYNIIKCIQGSHNGKISIEPIGINKYMILFLNRTYYSNPKFKTPKNKLAKQALIHHILRTIKIPKQIYSLD